MKNSFTPESPLSEIIEDNQVISEKYCGQKDIDIGEIVSKSDGGSITFDDYLRINLRDKKNLKKNFRILKVQFHTPQMKLYNSDWSIIPKC